MTMTGMNMVIMITMVHISRVNNIVVKKDHQHKRYLQHPREREPSTAQDGRTPQQRSLMPAATMNIKEREHENNIVQSNFAVPQPFTESKETNIPEPETQ